MHPSNASELAAVAKAALAQLDAYEATVRQMLQHPDDEILYAKGAQQFDAVRGLAASLPGLRARWVELLISRFELLEVLWQMKQGRTCADFDRLRTNHGASLQSFRSLCLQRITSDGSTASR